MTSPRSTTRTHAPQAGLRPLRGDDTALFALGPSAPFEYDFYAQTLFGQPHQGDAVYLRDLAAPHLGDLAHSYADEKLLKLACLYELFGLPDDVRRPRAAPRRPNTATRR
jgi:hypothetical protein